MIGAALILAGSRGGRDAVAEAGCVSNKVLVDLLGVPMLGRVIAAVEAAGITAIAVSTDDAAVAAEAARRGAFTLIAQAGPSASVADAIEGVGTPLLVTTGDHGLLRPEWIRDFVDRVPADTDVAVLLAPRTLVEGAAPGSRRTWLRFADGDWSGCNLFYLATPRAIAAVHLWQQVERDRKRPWRIVGRLGPGLLIRYLLGRLTLAEGIARLGRRAGVVAAVVAANNGRAAIDVDTPEDLCLVRRMLTQPDRAGGR